VTDGRFIIVDHGRAGRNFPVRLMLQTTDR
jgi:hypothetical protein